MKRTWYGVALAFSFFLFLVTSATAQQSLGDVARQQRDTKRPHAAKLYTNDDIAPSPEASAPAAATTPESAAANADEKARAEERAKAAEDRAKDAAAIKAKIDTQKKAIAQLEHELDLSQREYRLRAAAYYADAGNSLRDPKRWAEEDRQYRNETENKQKAIAEAKQKLDDLLEEARKAGIRAE